ncbi:MAG TPA: hypothetical protein VFM46_17180 [Pseudomonadales bacterium]|nr:hypothetical protein [Pseudomonadales bacterium]
MDEQERASALQFLSRAYHSKAIDQAEYRRQRASILMGEPAPEPIIERKPPLIHKVFAVVFLAVVIGFALL